MSNTFEAFSLDQTILHNLKALNITEPTPVQRQAIPILLEGGDLIAESQTGTGKTLAYALPILQRVDPALKKLQTLILVPTRELGAQISQVLEQVSEGTGILSQLLIGGAAIGRQIDRLRLHPQIAVGTPGRILELIKIRKLSMHHVRMIVIDEADQVFEQGEGQEVEAVIRSAMRDRQLCFFSATMPAAVRGLADRWMKDPSSVQVQPGTKTAETLRHQYVVCDDRERIDMLRKLVRAIDPQSGIVFTNQVDAFGEILAKLKYTGLAIEGLYSEAGKQERAKVIKDFREGRLKLLLATDVAARGLDFPGVTHVFHFDLPVDADHYVHRSGRTGRMGKEGTVISLCAPNQLFILEKFTRALGVSFDRKILYEGRLVSVNELPKRTLHGKLPGDSRGGRQPEADRGRQPKPGADRLRTASEERAGTGAVKDGGGRSVSGARGQAGSAGNPGKAGKMGKTGKQVKDADRKNKGAPRWLKEKRGQDPSS